MLMDLLNISLFLLLLLLLNIIINYYYYYFALNRLSIADVYRKNK